MLHEKNSCMKLNFQTQEETHLFDISDPTPDVVERFLVGDVINKHDALKKHFTLHRQDTIILVMLTIAPL
jgi:hypothetical protein